jgi:uncharacterized phage protein gp47/JayE
MPNLLDIRNKIDVIKKATLTDVQVNATNSLETLTAEILVQSEYHRQLAVENALNGLSYVRANAEQLLESAKNDNLGEPFPASIATGYILIQGLVTETILQNTKFTYNNFIYTSQDDASIIGYTLPIQSATHNNGVVTVLMNGEHGLTSGIKVNVAGFNEIDYNGNDLLITVIDRTTFRYNKLNITINTATGSGILSANYARIFVKSDETGVDKNAIMGNVFNIQTPLLNVEKSAYVDYNDIVGGADVEAIEEFRARCLRSKRAIKAMANDDYYLELVFGVRGVTRARVYPITPTLNSVTILFMRDNDFNPIPSTGEIQEVKNAIPIIVFLPNINVIVQAPAPVLYDINVSSLIPNTSAMRNNFTGIIQNYFRTLDIGQQPNLELLKNKLYTTQDVTGSLATSFLITITPNIPFTNQSVALVNNININ